MGKSAKIVFCIVVAVVVTGLYLVWKVTTCAALDRQALLLVEKWLQEGPPTTTMGRVRAHLSSLWWIGPGLVGATPDPLKECGVDLHLLEVNDLSWVDYLVKSDWQEAPRRLDCLKERMATAHQEHEAFTSRVKVMGVTCLVVVTLVLLKWAVSLLMNSVVGCFNILPQILKLEDPVPTQDYCNNYPMNREVNPQENEEKQLTHTDDEILPKSLSLQDSLPTPEEDNNDDNNQVMREEKNEETEQEEPTLQSIDDITVTLTDTTLVMNSDHDDDDDVYSDDTISAYESVHVLTFHLCDDDVKFTFYVKDVPPDFPHKYVQHIQETVMEEMNASSPQEAKTQIAAIIKRCIDE